MYYLLFTLLLIGSDNQVVIWNVGVGEPLIHIDCHPDIVFSASWNFDGSQLLTTCKDKKLRLINPRSGEVEQVIHLYLFKKIIKLIYIFINYYHRK